MIDRSSVQGVRLETPVDPGFRGRTGSASSGALRGGRVTPLVLLFLTAAIAYAGNERREPPETPPTPEIAADQFLSRDAFLASDELAGRESGTEGGRMTEEYVAAELGRIGLTPLGPDGSFFQDVPLPTRNPDPAGSSVAVLGASDAGAGTDSPLGTPLDSPLGAPSDVVPFAFSAAGSAQGRVAFAGFGLTDAANDYDDYVGLEVAGNVVVLLRHAPQEKDPESPWALKGARGARVARMLSFTAKAARAAEAGAVAVLIVNDYNHEEDGLPVTVRGRTAKVPVLAVSRDVAERLFEGSGTTLKELQAAIDGDRRPRSRLLEVSVAVVAAVESQMARNAVAVLPGSDPALADQAVVFCAHMDHVGMGWFGSRGGSGEIHNGADDNGSGTAALLEAAEWMTSRPAPRRSVIFAFWCGEEKGLVGSRHYTQKPLWPLDKTIACVNMDMVGRYRVAKDADLGLMIGGAPTGSTFTEIVERLSKAAGARFTHTWEAFQQSDHFAFYAKSVPSLFFTTGLHDDYHRPTDDWWLINADGAVLVTKIAAEATLELANAGVVPQFVKRPPQPVLGVRLADDPDRVGALMGMVFPKMGAANAGIERGDLVVEWNGAPVSSAADLGKLIRAGAAGDVVNVTILRGEERLTLPVTLSGR